MVTEKEIALKLSKEVAIALRAQGIQATLTRETDIDVPLDALPVDVQEILLAPTVDTMAERIVRRVRCLMGPNVREIRTHT